MSWFSDRWGAGGPFGWAAKTVDRNRNAIGDVIKYGSDIVAPFTGPFAPLVAGAGNALGTGIHEGTNIGDIAKSGVTGAAIGAAGGALGKAFGAGSGTGGSLAAQMGDASADAAGNGIASGAGGVADAGASSAIQSALNTGAPKTLTERVGSAIGNVGSWAAKHPETVSAGLNALGNTGVNAAKSKQIALENEQMQALMDRQKSLDPLRAALAKALQQHMMGPSGPVAPNPYAR